MKVQAFLRKKHNDKTGKSEWALVSKKSGRVLRWFGAQHPSKERVAKEERRIQYFKHHGALDADRFPAIAMVLAMDIVHEPVRPIPKPEFDPGTQFDDSDDYDPPDPPGGGGGGNKPKKPPIELDKHPKAHLLRMLMDERKKAIQQNNGQLAHQAWLQLEKIVPDRDQLNQLIKTYQGPIK